MYVTINTCQREMYFTAPQGIIVKKIKELKCRFLYMPMFYTVRSLCFWISTSSSLFRVIPSVLFIVYKSIYM